MGVKAYAGINMSPPRVGVQQPLQQWAPQQQQPLQQQHMQQQALQQLFPVGLYPMQHNVPQLAANHLQNLSPGLQQQQQQPCRNGFVAFLNSDDDYLDLQAPPAAGFMGAAAAFSAAAAAAAAPAAPAAAARCKIDFPDLVQLGFPTGIIKFQVGGAEVMAKVVDGGPIEWPISSTGSGTGLYSALAPFHRAVTASEGCQKPKKNAWVDVKLAGTPLQLWREAARAGQPLPLVPQQCIVG
jgi:hypothetical protein